MITVGREGMLNSCGSRGTREHHGAPALRRLDPLAGDSLPLPPLPPRLLAKRATPTSCHLGQLVGKIKSEDVSICLGGVAPYHTLYIQYGQEHGIKRR